MEHQEVLTSVRKILRAINLESKRIQKEYGVSIPQLLCLGHLNQRPELQSTVKELSAALSLNSSTISGIIKRLEAKGFVAKLPNPADGRGSIIALTVSGRKLLDGTPTLLHYKLGRALEKLDDQSLQQLKQSLALLVEMMGITSLDASPILSDGATMEPQGVS